MNPLCPLDQMDANYHPAEMYGKMLASAQRWIEVRNASPGIGYMISGPVGLGKTTIIMNLLNSAVVNYGVPDDNGGYERVFKVIAGRYYTATELMSILDPGHRLGQDKMMVGRAKLLAIFRGLKIIAVDDVGTEEIPYQGKNAPTARRNRYGEFVDFCLINKISIVLSSMVPIATLGNTVNPAFIDIVGAKAFDRLLQISKGYTWSISDTKSYRREL